MAEALSAEINTVGNWRRRGFPNWAIPKLARLCEDCGIDPGDALESQPPRRQERRAEPEAAA